MLKNAPIVILGEATAKVDPENEDEIADAIRYLLDHPDEARQIGENGRRAVKEKFNWSVEEKKLLALYEDILNEK